MRFLLYRLSAAAFGGVCKSGPPRKGFLPPCGETGDAERRNEGRIIVFLSVRSLSPRRQRMSKFSSSRPSSTARRLSPGLTGPTPAGVPV